MDMLPLQFLLIIVPTICVGNFLPILPIFQGNKPRTVYKAWQELSSQGYYGKCEGLIRKWSSWGSGLDGQLVIKKRGEPAVESWRFTIEFDKDVDSCNIFDANVSKISDRKYEASSLSWNRAVATEQERVLKLQVKWKTGTAVPKPKIINIDGVGHVCVGEAIVDEEDVSNQGLVEEADNIVDSEGECPKVEESLPIIKADRGIFAKWPTKVMGLYILLADDDYKGYRSEDVWYPRLYPYQQTGANVLFFTFIHPETMKIPPAFQNLAQSRGESNEGSVPKDTVILFAIGGYAYSLNVKPWPWLTTKEAAETMAEKVATWPEKYGCDGIDLDIEDGAGDQEGAGENMIHFVRRLRRLSPRMIISQPTYGYPAIDAEIELINASWDADGNSHNLADSIGIMVYEGTSSLNYVKNYVKAGKRWDDFPITANAASNTILLGAKGSAGAIALDRLVDETLRNDYLGIMVWYASVQNGLQYGPSWDASTDEEFQTTYIDGMKKFNDAMKKID